MRLDEIPDPEPKPGWVVCRVRRVQPSITDVQRALGIGTMGIHAMREQIKKHVPVQLLGHEMSAEVIAVGEGVKNFKVGDIVCTSGHVPCGQCYWCRSGHDGWCLRKVDVGLTIPGAFAEKIALSEAALVKAPDTLDDASIACLQPLSTTVAGVRDASLRPGETIAITGQGVMGIYMLQAVRMCGAGAVYVTDVKEEALALGRRFKADAVVDAQREDPIERVRDLTEDRGVDIVFECAGGNPDQGLSGHITLHQAFRMVRLGGRVIQIAGLLGEVRVDPEELRRRGIKWIFLEGHGNKTLAVGAQWVASGRIDVRSLISHEVFGIKSLPKAMEITHHKEKYRATNPCQVVMV